MAAWRQISIGLCPFHSPGYRVGFAPPRCRMIGRNEPGRQSSDGKGLSHHIRAESGRYLENHPRFNNYPVWVAGAGESEDGKTGDTMGAVRNVLYWERRIRHRLLVQSDVERSQTYEFAGTPHLPMTGFQATLRVTPVIDGDRAFVEWWATFDCEAASRDELTGTLQGSFEKWLESLRDTLAA